MSWLLRLATALGTFRSLRHRNYRLYFFGQLISMSGSAVQGYALAWLAYDLSHLSRWPAFMMAALALPTLLLGPLGGALADRWPKRSLLLWTQSVMLVLAVLLVAAVGTGEITTWQLLWITLAAGLAQAIDFPARLSFVMEMVGKEDLINAVALNSLLFNVARFVGPAVGAVILVACGPMVCFLANALSFVPLLFALAWMDSNQLYQPEPARNRPSLLAGFALVGSRTDILLLILGAAAVGFTVSPFISLLPAYADHVLQLPKRGLGLLMAGTGLGALTAALVVATFGSRPDCRRWFLVSGICICSASLVGLAVADGTVLATVCCTAAGFGLILFLSTCQGVVQLNAGDHSRGQVMGVWAMVMSGALPLGHLAIGPSGDIWGEKQVLLIAGLTCAAVSLLLAFLAQLIGRKGIREPGPSDDGPRS